MALVESRTGTVRQANWNEDETFSLLEILKSHASALRFNKRNIIIYKKMSALLLTHGHQRSAKEIKKKIHNLNQRYRQENKRMEESEGKKSHWRFYSTYHEIYGNLPLVNPPSQIGAEENKLSSDGEPRTDTQAMDTEEQNYCAADLKDIDETVGSKRPTFRVENVCSLSKKLRKAMFLLPKEKEPVSNEEKSYEALRKIIQNQERMIRNQELQITNQGTIIQLLAKQMNLVIVNK